MKRKGRDYHQRNIVEPAMRLLHLLQDKELEKAAMKMTEIVQAALDKFPPRERARRVRAYLGRKAKP